MLRVGWRLFPPIVVTMRHAGRRYPCLCFRIAILLGSTFPSDSVWQGTLDRPNERVELLPLLHVLFLQTSGILFSERNRRFSNWLRSDLNPRIVCFIWEPQRNQSWGLGNVRRSGDGMGEVRLTTESSD